MSSITRVLQRIIAFEVNNSFMTQGQHFGDVDVLLKAAIHCKTEVIGDVAIEFFEF